MSKAHKGFVMIVVAVRMLSCLLYQNMDKATIVKYDSSQTEEEEEELSSPQSEELISEILVELPSDDITNPQTETSPKTFFIEKDGKQDIENQKKVLEIEKNEEERRKIEEQQRKKEEREKARVEKEKREREKEEREQEEVELQKVEVENVKEDIELFSRDRSGTTTFTATAYDLSVQSCGKAIGHKQYGVTRSGYNISGMSREEAMVIAVDPNIIPLGAKVRIYFPEPYTHFNGVYTARDTGGAIKGNKIDVFMGDFQQNKTHQDVWDFGVRKVEVEIIR